MHYQALLNNSSQKTEHLIKALMDDDLLRYNCKCRLRYIADVMSTTIMNIFKTPKVFRLYVNNEGSEERGQFPAQLGIICCMGQNQSASGNETKNI